MGYNSFTVIVALLAFMFAGLSLVPALLYRRRAAKLSRELSIALEKLAAAHAEMQLFEQRQKENLEFQKNLGNAELTTRLQQSRLTAQHGHNRVGAPERYLYVRSLAENGMSAQEIAEILSISKQEAEQLVNLSKLATLPA